MRNIKPADVCAGVLALCAFATTIAVLKREVAPASSIEAATDEIWNAKYVDDWQDALAVGIRVGPPNSLVQVVVFEDFQCPYCARFDDVVKVIRKRYPDQVAFAFAPFPLSYHDFAETAHRVVECAHIQGHYDEMRSILFNRQQALGSLSWTYFAEQAGVRDIGAFDMCVNAAASMETIEQSKVIADALGVRGTPAIFVNGWKLPMVPSLEVFDRIVINAIEGRQPTEDISFAPPVAQN
jgi:protein-disulfide isomerase